MKWKTSCQYRDGISEKLSIMAWVGDWNERELAAVKEIVPYYSNHTQ